MELYGLDPRGGGEDRFAFDHADGVEVGRGGDVLELEREVGEVADVPHLRVRRIEHLRLECPIDSGDLALPGAREDRVPRIGVRLVVLRAVFVKATTEGGTLPM